MTDTRPTTDLDWSAASTSLPLAALLAATAVLALLRQPLHESWRTR